MFARIAKWLSAPKTTTRRTSTRLGLEGLEFRDTPSVSSPEIHAVTAQVGHVTANEVFSINENNHLVDIGTYPLNGGTVNQPVNVKSLSAGHDASGIPDVFVTAGDGSFWEWKSANGWSELQGPGQVGLFAAVDGGRVYAIFPDQSLREFNGSTWFRVPNSGSVTNLDAITDATGHDAIYVMNADKSFGEIAASKVLNAPPTNSLLVVASPGDVSLNAYTQLAAAGTLPSKAAPVHFATVLSFSAGLDVNGHADVFATRFGGSLQKNVGGTAANWSDVAAAGTYKQFSAADQGQVWAIDVNNKLERYDAAGTLHTMPNFGKTFVSLAGVGVNRDANGVVSHKEDVYLVATDGTLCEYYEDVNVSYPVFSQLSAPNTVSQ